MPLVRVTPLDPVLQALPQVVWLTTAAIRYVGAESDEAGPTVMVVELLDGLQSLVVKEPAGVVVARVRRAERGGR